MKPDLAKAAVVSLEHRGETGPGWCEIMRAAAWARLCKGDMAMKEVGICIKDHIWPNGLSSINKK